MGPSASLSYLLKEFKSLIPYRYDDLSNARNKLTPSQYQEHMKPIVARWEHTADSLIQICRPSAKAARLIKNKADLQAGGLFFDFLMSRDYYASRIQPTKLESERRRFLLRLLEEDAAE